MSWTLVVVMLASAAAAPCRAAFAAAFAEDGPTLIQVASAMGDVRVFGQAFA